ncbi:MAG: NAD(P)H-dependent oxidoreductase subunit E [Candidatus Sumerlaeia bacterium]|nr:NAD(P)H-dependent oxidoreductase subunit E [Candidatus Sumerlaeia bacterium]
MTHAAPQGILDARIDEIEAICAKYPSRRSAMLPVLWMVQQQEGWISQAAMKEVAEVVGCTAAEVYEVVSFYTMFQQRPTGKYHIGLCKTLACAICGAFEASDYIASRYHIPPGGVSPDGRFSMEHVECIGACSEAPAMLVGPVLHGNLTPARINEILDHLS